MTKRLGQKIMTKKDYKINYSLDYGYLFIITACRTNVRGNLDFNCFLVCYFLELVQAMFRSCIEHFNKVSKHANKGKTSSITCTNS